MKHRKQTKMRQQTKRNSVIVDNVILKEGDQYFAIHLLAGQRCARKMRDETEGLPKAFMEMI